VKKTDESHVGEISHIYKKNNGEPEKGITIPTEPSTEIECTRYRALVMSNSLKALVALKPD